MLTILSTLLSSPGVVSSSDSCAALKVAQANQADLNHWKEPQSVLTIEDAHKACECGDERSQLILLAEENEKKSEAYHRIRAIVEDICYHQEPLGSSWKGIDRQFCNGDKIVETPWKFLDINYLDELRYAVGRGRDDRRRRRGDDDGREPILKQRLSVLFNEIIQWRNLNWTAEARDLFDSFKNRQYKTLALPADYCVNRNTWERWEHEALKMYCVYSQKANEAKSDVNVTRMKKEAAAWDTTCASHQAQCHQGVTKDGANLDALQVKCGAAVKCQRLYRSLKNADPADFDKNKEAITACGTGFWEERFRDLLKEVTEWKAKKDSRVTAAQKKQECEGFAASAESEKSAAAIEKIKAAASNCDKMYLRRIQERLDIVNKAVDNGAECEGLIVIAQGQSSADDISKVLREASAAKCDKEYTKRIQSMIDALKKPEKNGGFGSWARQTLNSGKQAVVSTAKAIGGAIGSATGESSAELFYQANRLQITLAALKPKDMIYDIQRRIDTAKYFLKFLKEVEHASDDDIDVQIAQLEILNSEAMIDLIDEVKDDEIASRDGAAPRVYVIYQGWKVRNAVSDVSTYVSDKASRASRAVTSSAKALKQSSSKRVHELLKAYANEVNDLAESITVDESFDDDQDQVNK